MQYRLQGIIIRSMDYGEGNKIVTLFTREHGKMSVVARGAKKVKSRFGSAVQLFTLGDFSFFKSGQNGLGSMNQADIVEAHHALREDLHLAAYASYLAELTDKMFGDHEGHPYLYEQLKGSFQAMDDKKDAQIVMHMYEIKMLIQAGYSPELHQCVVCGSQKEAVALSVGLGGILCEMCKLRDPQAIALAPAVLKLLRAFAQTDVRRLGEISVKEASKQALKHILRAYFDHHVGVRLKSRDFIEQMERYGI
ncbi:DNA replication and repair protein RecO [Paenibacillus sp. UNCCL117]|uniref:DNA repair protein RecO n=1 Tax=unclassified Paenibacillus TaxID=185978 RepID=UPI0008827307|nr:MULTISPECIES: DNA repair protein RecO [unclassified Paenibacillus]SDC72619.1 DNA replication and repair protein RecO [Paenibacillus sp. cl123]SFW24821.1 DNA replication and repair protein RecO [Paenibacillus sp. UNCCL117]